jgi:AraC family transcriptional regulator
MKWINHLNEAIAYIEAHLTDEIELDRLAQIACCSTFHFQRMFSYIAEVPLSEYIRRRKMSRAAFDLQNSTDKISDIALKYGYESPTAFNRAFQTIHGVAPSIARSEGTRLKAYPPISFKLSIKGETELNYRIEKKASFKIVGFSEHYAVDIAENFGQIPLFWDKMAQQGLIPKLASQMTHEPFGLLGVSTCMDGQSFDYYIAVATENETPTGMAEYIVPACTWAIFESVGALPNALQDLQRRIITEWLPSSGYEYANAPDIEVYLY